MTHSDIASDDNALRQSKDSEALSVWVQEQALWLGFSRVGIVPVPNLSGEAERLQQWLSLGYQADMAWMSNHLTLRKSPEGLLENASSIVCVALNYFTPDSSIENEPPEALKIARYARGRDYHKVLRKKLAKLLEAIQVHYPGIQGRVCVDSAPVMEKPLGVQAGLGWTGKNGNLIAPQLGSWFVLGELILDVSLPSSIEPVSNHCGNCTRCIDACPTEAIVADGVIDANKCISYWTIESKNESLPKEIAENLQGWVFGCDICQEVCPWNQTFAQPTQELDFAPRPATASPNADTILAMDDDSFLRAYAGTPVMRTGRAGLQRNVTAWNAHSREKHTRKD